MCIMMVLGLISFSACTKDSSDNNNVIRFDFSSTRAGDFSIEGKAGSDNFTASLLNADNWSKTITVTKSYSVADSAAFTVLSAG